MFWLEHNLLLVIPSIIIGFTIHEFFHAYISFKLGDITAKEDGRITLNPIKHVDMIGLISLLLLGFGWAKPVIVNPSYYKKPVRDMTLVALAGPLSNIALAIIGIFLSVIFMDVYLSYFFIYFWIINLSMAVFNLIPIPPLDGSKIIGFFMKSEAYQGYINNEKMGWVLLIFMIYFDVFSLIMNPIIDFIINFVY